MSTEASYRGVIYNTPDNYLILEQNTAVAIWSSMVTSKLKSSAKTFSKGKTEGMVQRGQKTGYPHDEKKLDQSINRKLYKSDALIEGVGIRFERHGVFVQKGVGKGYIMVGGTVKRGYKTSKQDKLYAKAKNRSIATKMAIGGTMNRHAKDWFNSIIKSNVPELFEKIAKINADATVNAMHIMIK